MAEELQTQGDSTASAPAAGLGQDEGASQPAPPGGGAVASPSAGDSSRVVLPLPTHDTAASSGRAHPSVRTADAAVEAPIRPKPIRKPKKEKGRPRADSICPFGVPQQGLSQLFLSEQASALRLPDGMARLAEADCSRPVELWEGALQRPPAQRDQPLGRGMLPADTPAYLGPATLLLLVGVAVLVRLRYWGHYLLHLSLLRDARSIRRMELEATVKMEVFNSMGDILFALTCGYLIWRSVLFFGLQESVPSIRVYLLAMAFSAGYVLVRFLGLHLGPLLLGDGDAARTLWRQEEYSARLVWLPLLLVDITATYSGVWGARVALLSGLALIATSSLYTWVRVGLTFLGKGYRPFFFFLYFCGLEIVPILLMLKVVAFL